jgi:hypothetical protein
MSKPVNDRVSKEWARSVKQLLAGCYHDMTSLFTKLYTLETHHAQDLKTAAARSRLESGTACIIEAVKYGWAFGLNERQLLIKKPIKVPGSRRLKALLTDAIAQGIEIGKTQSRRITVAHGVPRPGTFKLPPPAAVRESAAK